MDKKLQKTGKIVKEHSPVEVGWNIYILIAKFHILFYISSIGLKHKKNPSFQARK